MIESVVITNPAGNGNGNGAAVDVSGLGAQKTVSVAGNFNGILKLMGSNDGGATWAPIASFQGPTTMGPIDAAVGQMRLEVSGWSAGTYSLSVGSESGDADVPQAYLAARAGKAYFIECPIQTIPTTELNEIYIKNNETDKILVLSAGARFWNGGSTNHNRSLYDRHYAEPAAPSAFFTDVGLVPATPDTPAADVVVLVWDGVGGGGAGMTVADRGILASSIICGPGMTPLDSKDAYMLWPGASTLISAQAEEIGACSAEILCFLVPI